MVAVEDLSWENYDRWTDSKLERLGSFPHALIVTKAHYNEWDFVDLSS
jgi:hypothetical protein